MASTSPGGPDGARTVLEVVRLSTTYLSEHGSDSARLDAELLVAHALGIERLGVYLQYDRPLADHDLAIIRALLRQRGRGEPIAHLTGRREFYGRNFRVTPAVLIPRPETETLVERALAVAREQSGELRIADLGTGSGCLACTLAAELPGATVIASDLSAAALAVAAENAEALGVAGRVLFVEGGWAEGLVAGLDLVVSNPPYITSAEMEELPRDVTFEPRLALEGGADGLDAYRDLLPAVAERAPGVRWVGLEVDSRRADAVAELSRGIWPEAAIVIVNDLARRPRVVEIRGGLP
ncbi:MAG: peptide chain release factor N(5)-glutamine methyltransferase [Candidatus Dormibacteria bacterium]|jgi:release factor glutamine methyltransferase